MHNHPLWKHKHPLCNHFMELSLCSGDLGNLWQDQGASESKVGNQIGPNSTRWQNMNHSECEKDLYQVK